MSESVQELLDRVIAGLEAEDPHALTDAVTGERAADLAEVMNLLEDEQRSRLIYALPPRIAAEVVVLLDDAVRSEVVEDLGDRKLSEIVTELPPDDAVNVLAALPAEQSDEVLEQIPQVQSDELAELLTYDRNSAGGIMNPRLVWMPARSTVAEAVDKVREFSADEEIHFAYIVDDEHRLLGIVPLRRLVVNKPSTRLEAICDRDPITVSADVDQEEVLRVIRKYDIPALPVVDADGRLLGRITHDDVMDVAEQEADEDIYRMAGTDSAELETHSSVRAARVRMLWLIPCMIGTSLAGAVIAFFRDTRLSASQLNALLLFVPMIAATGGNAGIQTSVIILRGFVTGELGAMKLRWVFFREARIALLVSLLCAAVAGALGGAGLTGLKWVNSEVGIPADVEPLWFALSVGVGMCCGVLEAAALGISLPFLFRRWGIDPAIASGPLITTINDCLSVATYLTISLWVLS